MSETAQKYLQMLKRKPAEPEESGQPEERDLALARLEREVAEERENAATLCKTIDDLRFQIKTLEASYAKQLEDARERIANAERTIEEEKANTAGAREECDAVKQALQEAQARIERLSAGADLMASMNAPPNVAAQMTEDTMSIDEMLADATIAPDSEKEEQEEQSSAEPEDPAEDMLSPDLVFAPKREA